MNVLQKRQIINYFAKKHKKINFKFKFNYFYFYTVYKRNYLKTKRKEKHTWA